MIIKLQKGQKLTMDQAADLFIVPNADEQRFEIETRGPWGMISKCRGLATCQDFETGELTIYGYRTLSAPRQSGHELEGYVSIGGVRRSAFTSSHLFELENGHLIDVAVLHAREAK